MKKIFNKSVILLFSTSMLFGCNTFLEEKSDKKLGIPTTVSDFKAIIADWAYLNSNYSSMGEASSDDIIITDADFNGLYYESDKRLYSWMPDYVTRSYSGAGHEWSLCYKGIYTCNAVLKGLEDNKLIGKDADEVKGQALVFRAARYLDGVQIWAPIYDKGTADQALGMVLRVDPDFNLPSVRATVRQTYDLILDDLAKAIPLLPTQTISPSLPTTAAAYSLLARAYLVMGEYDKALTNAEEALEFGDYIIDFNNLDPNITYPIPTLNQDSKEMVFSTRMFSSEIVKISFSKINRDLYDLYDKDDLRKSVYFREDLSGNVFFKGTHTGSQGLTTGLTGSEMLLIIAECKARLDQLSESASVMSKLKTKRWNKNTYSPIIFNNKETALKEIMQERRRELVLRGLRWSDIKRFNRDGENITLRRKVNGKELLLSPKDKRYAIAIPEDVIEVAGIVPNPR